MSITVYTLHAFAKTSAGGNPAGVVLDADGLTEKEMADIARQVGFSETAFVQKSDKADYKVRFFTPNSEVQLCGHATIATFTLLKEKGYIGDGFFQQETQAGILAIEVREGKVYMEQPLPKFFDIISKSEIAAVLNICADELLPNLPVQIVSTGLKDIMIPVKRLDCLLKLKPDLKKIMALSKKYGAVGLHVFSLETLLGGAAHARNFAPLYQIDEESATGTSNGALACYLYNYGIHKEAEFTFEQGYAMGKPSEIVVSLKTEEKGISAVQVGGTAILWQELQL